jgi:hypothetical protein
MWLRYDTALPRTPMLQAPLIALTLLASCGGGGETAEPFEEPAWRSYDPPAVETPPASLKRLTAEQYQSALTALFGESLILPTSLEPDEPVDGLRVVGASVTSLSSRGVEQYEEAALNVAAQLVESPELQAALVRCEPAATRDDACAAEALEDLAWRAWRRPVEGGELEVLVDLAGRGADTLGDFYEGLTFAVAAVLQSPWFLYRVELGEPDPLDPSRWRYTDYEMASRLAWFLWNTLPDDALLAAAEAGALTGDEGLAEQVDRMLADPRARDGVRSFFTDAWLLYELDALSKDPDVFPNMSELVGPSAREETLLGLEHLIFEEQGDWRDALTSQRTFVDRTLAAIYDVPAPTMDGFGEIRLEESGGRRGLLGQVSVLGLHSHAVSTSVTRRGIFVRQVLLCQTLPARGRGHLDPRGGRRRAHHARPGRQPPGGPHLRRLPPDHRSDRPGAGELRRAGAVAGHGERRHHRRQRRPGRRGLRRRLGAGRRGARAQQPRPLHGGDPLPLRQRALDRPRRGRPGRLAHPGL